MLHRESLALGVQQPWAELIVRGIKTIEVRSRATKMRGPIYVYASRRRSRSEEAIDAAARHGIDVATLATGRIVGSVELVDCRLAIESDVRVACVSQAMLVGQFAWLLAKPECYGCPVDVERVPYGIWFYPFGRASREEDERDRAETRRRGGKR